MVSDAFRTVRKASAVVITRRARANELATRRDTLDQVNESYQDLRDGKIIRGAIEFD